MREESNPRHVKPPTLSRRCLPWGRPEAIRSFPRGRDRTYLNANPGPFRPKDLSTVRGAQRKLFASERNGGIQHGAADDCHDGCQWRRMIAAALGQQIAGADIQKEAGKE